MKRVIAAVIFLLSLFSFAGCAETKYRESDFLGKTSAQIEAEFGTFDCVLMPPDGDGLYRSSSCGYTIREPKVGFLGTDPEILFFITFDENGIAYQSYKGYRPGG